jgi:hypothetical protein
MTREISRRISARVATIELRALLAADAHIPLRQRKELVDRVSVLVDDDEAASALKARLVELIERRFGRNPDTFEVSDATLEALQLLNAVQARRMK